MQRPETGKSREVGVSGNTVRAQGECRKDMRESLWIECLCPLEIHMLKS